MAEIFECTTNQDISLAEFHAAIDDCPLQRFGDDHLQACAMYLQRLSNNRDLFFDLVCDLEGAKDIGRFFHAPQSFFIGAGRSHYLRLNVWLPENSSAPFAQYERDLYAYDIAHNHDFRFMTVGFFGPGYETDIYEIPSSQLNAAESEPVDLFNYRRVQLVRGRVIHFRPFLDVHVQRQPSDLSVSINLIFFGESPAHEQCFVDVAKSKIAGHPSISMQSRLITVMEMAKLFVTPTVTDALGSLGQNSAFPRVRNHAEFALQSIVQAEVKEACSPGQS